MHGKWYKIWSETYDSWKIEKGINEMNPMRFLTSYQFHGIAIWETKVRIFFPFVCLCTPSLFAKSSKKYLFFVLQLIKNESLKLVWAYNGALHNVLKDNLLKSCYIQFPQKIIILYIFNYKMQLLVFLVFFSGGSPTPFSPSPRLAAGSRVINISIFTIQWNKATIPISFGGLGIRRIDDIPKLKI